MNKRAKIMIAAICGIAVISGAIIFSPKKEEKKSNIADTEVEQSIAEDEKYQKEQEDLAKRIDKNLEEKSKLEEKEGVAEPESLTSTSKKDKNKTTDTVGTDKKPSKPTTESGGNGNTSENTNKTPSKNEVVPGFSKDEIIDGGDNVENISPGGSGDDTPVGEM